ncbi:MAG: hypothetical protein H5T86_08225, partial [Armatimonadetes bacterium]|nr:hypothetical protein [Armatimonadota bacterium]
MRVLTVFACAAAFLAVGIGRLVAEAEVPEAAAPAQQTARPEAPAPPSTPPPAASPTSGKQQNEADRGEEKEADKKQPERTIDIKPSDHGWSVHAVNADAHELLTEFARRAGLKLIIDDTVKRKVTIHIENKPAQDVIDLIVDAYGFSAANVDGVIIVSEGIPENPSSYLLSDIACVTTKYVAPAQAQKLLPVFLRGQVKVNTDQNSVVLSGPKPVLEKFRQDVSEFDVPAQQIMLDVLVVEFRDIDTDTFTAQLGFSNARFGVYTDSLTGNLTLSAIAKLPTDFYARLRALIEARKAHVRANPRIATVSGQPASIFIGVQQYLSTPVSLQGSRTSNSIDAGVSLEMTPLTGGDNEIILDISEEISTLSAPDPVTGLPTKTTRSADTTVRVRDGETIVIGGLKQQESRSTRRAIPILGNIPLIGELFKSRKVEKTQVDLAIFITARMLSQTGHLPPEEECQ